VTQGGAGPFTGAVYGVDMFLGSVLSVDFAKDTVDVPPRIASSIRMGASGGSATLRHGIELEETGGGGQMGSGNNYTLSFYAKANTPFTMGVTGRFSDQVAVSTNSPGTDTFTSADVTGSWKLFTSTISMGFDPAATNKTYFLEWLVDNTITLNIAGIQFERGTIATSLERLQRGEILARCHRRRIRYSRDVSPTTSSQLSVAQATSTTEARGHISFPVEMRDTPAYASSGVAAISATTAAGSGTPGTANTSTNLSTLGADVRVTVGAVLAAGNASELNLATSSWIEFTANL
jgi:hypothetical protein